MVVRESDLQSGAVTLDKVRQDRQNKELLVWLESEYNKAREARLTYERQWYINLAFYFGRHYVQWTSTATTSTNSFDSGLSRLYEPAAPPWRVRLVTNKVRTMIRGELSKVTREKARGYVIPRTTDEEDQAAARAGDSLHDFLWRELQMNRVFRRAQFWNLICGTSFIKDWYDKDMVDASKQKGKICAEPVTPFHVLVDDPQEEELENQSKVIHVVAKTTEWVFEKYGISVQPDSHSGAGLLEQRFLSAAGLNSSQARQNFVAVKEAWIKPCGRFKKGAVITWCKDALLNAAVEQWPYQHNEFPFAKLEHIPTGRFYGDSTLVDLIPLQREFNRTRSQLIEAKNRMSKPQLIAPRGSVNPAKITSEPGLVIEYTPGFQPPAPLPLQNVPGYVIEEYNRIQRDMDDISSQHEITKGSVPPGVTAATAIAYLQEQDDSKLAPTISSLEEAVEKIGRHFLNHVQQFWVAERTVQVIGYNGAFESFMFSKSNIKGNTDFRVESGSATPISRAAKQASILEYVKLGMIPPDKALRYINMGEIAKLYEEMQIDSRQAQRENLQMSQGMLVPPNEWDNDQLHVLEHDNFRKTQEFETLPDEVKVIFQQHVQGHKQKVTGQAGIPMTADNPELGGAFDQLTQGGGGNPVQVGGPEAVPPR